MFEFVSKTYDGIDEFMQMKLGVSPTEFPQTFKSLLRAHPDMYEPVCLPVIADYMKNKGLFLPTPSLSAYVEHDPIVASLVEIAISIVNSNLAAEEQSNNRNKPKLYGLR